LLPVCRVERGRDAARQQVGKKTSLQTPSKIEKRKDEVATGSPFL
jgi:hypothetical protein